MAQHSSFGIVRSASTWSIVWGVLLILFGMLAVGSPFPAAVAVNAFIAWLLVLAGVVHLTVAFHTREAGSLIWRVLVGLAYLSFGVYLIMHPALGVASLTLVLASLFLVEGILNIALFFQVRSLQGSAWLLIDGVITLLLGMICRKHRWLLCLLLGLLTVSEACENKSVAAAPAPPPTVQVVEVAQRDVPVYHEWIATLDGFVNAIIQPQVSGYLVQQNYREGALVRKNDVLFKIDPRPFQAILDQAKAQLAQAEAQLGKTQLDVQRDTPLAKEKAIAQSQLDNDIQANLAAKATVQAGKAAVEQAEINLEFTNVRSLVDGVAGIATGQVGNLVGPQTILTTVSQLDPIKAYFVASEQQYLAFVQRNPTVASREKTERELILELILADGSTYPKKGKFYAADRHVDAATGAIRLAGIFPNPDNVLRPGQYGRVRFVSYIRPGALLVPQKAVTELQGMYQVAVVGSDDKVSIRTVQVGERTGPMWIIEQGVKPGERVVVEGVQKVRDGMPVKVATATASM